MILGEILNEIILGGDFNIVPDAKIDRIPIPIKPSSSDSELSKFCENLGIIDIWRNKHPLTHGVIEINLNSQE